MVIPMAFSLEPIADEIATIFPVPPIHEPARGAKISISEDVRSKITKLRIKAIKRLRLAKKKLRSIFGPSLNKSDTLFGSNIKKSMAGKRLLFKVQ